MSSLTPRLPDDRAAKIELLELLEERERRAALNKIATYFPDTGPLRRELYPQHLEFFKLGREYPTRCFMAANRVGKALKHGTRVATPTGWRPIEELSVGDKVMSGDGTVTTVIGVYPQGEVDLYSLSFDGAREIITCGDHLWKYQHPRARYPYRQSHGKKEPNPFYGQWEVGNTRRLAEFGAIPRTRAVVPNTMPFVGEAADLPVDPYVLGLLLGDGGLSRDSVKFSSVDQESVEAIRQHYRVTHYEGCDYGVGVTTEIRKLGLLGKRSSDKFVPKEYLAANPEQRLALLQGLMDSDGYCSKTGSMEYSTNSSRLAEDVEWLCASLGIKCRSVYRHTQSQDMQGKPSWRLILRSKTLCPFRLSRKVRRWRPLKETGDWVLHGVKPAGRGMATCIEVNDPSHTFVIEGGIVTHNTEGGGGYELTLHLTGEYPGWWEGYRFENPIDAWAAGDTNETVRDIIQFKLLGPKESPGTGLIPGRLIKDIKYRQGGNGSVDYVLVEHAPTGKVSRLGFKSYEQGRKSFQGTEKDVIWLDEEANPGIRAECIIRLMTTAGLLIETFTPLRGLTEIVTGYLGEGGLKSDSRVQINGERAMVMAGWDDVPHLSESEKKRMLAECEPHLKKSRSKGIPSLGAGAIYPVEEEEITVKPFMIPAHWPRAYGMDVGWKRTAAIWGATDPETGVTYLYSEYYRGQAEPSIHVTGIKTRGDWIPGAIDPAARGANQKDGENLLEIYEGLGLILNKADNAVEAGIHEVFEKLSTGQLKVFSTLQRWLAEYRIYRRDENGKIIKANDHLMDATRYFVRTGLELAITKPFKRGSKARKRNWKSM